MKNPKNPWNKDYTATVQLKNISFSDSDLMIEELLFENVGVGWLPG